VKQTTKDRIIKKAIQLFNKVGFGAVSLHEIAGELDMTRGNLTYHFKDKDQLLEAIADELWTNLDRERGKTRMLPSFENMHRDIQLFYRYQQKYAFVFLDHHVLSHSVLKTRFRKMSEQRVEEIKATIAFAISAGNMNPEPYEGIYQNLAQNTWMVSFFWMHEQLIGGQKKVKSFEEAEMRLWSLLLPHLTTKGLKAFRKFFGKDYLKNLGESFKADITEYVKF